MARKRKPSGQLWRGPFNYDHLRQAVEAAGCTKLTGTAAGTNHPAWRGITGEKVSLDEKWDGIRANDELFKSVARGAGVSARQLLRLLQDVRR